MGSGLGGGIERKLNRLPGYKLAKAYTLSMAGGPSSVLAMLRQDCRTKAVPFVGVKGALCEIIVFAHNFRLIYCPSRVALA